MINGCHCQAKETKYYMKLTHDLIIESTVQLSLSITDRTIYQVTYICFEFDVLYIRYNLSQIECVCIKNFLRLYCSHTVCFWIKKSLPFTSISTFLPFSRYLKFKKLTTPQKLTHFFPFISNGSK